MTPFNRDLELDPIDWEPVNDPMDLLAVGPMADAHLLRDPIKEEV